MVRLAQQLTLASTFCFAVSDLSLGQSASSSESAPQLKMGTFTQALYDEVKQRGWTVDLPANSASGA